MGLKKNAQWEKITDAEKSHTRIKKNTEKHVGLFMKITAACRLCADIRKLNKQKLQSCIKL